MSAVAAASGAQESEISITYGPEIEGAYAVQWNIDSADAYAMEAVARTSFTNKVKAELLPTATFQDCFSLSSTNLF